MPIRVGSDQVVAHHLTKNRLPLTLVVFRSNAKGRQLIVSTLTHFFGIISKQNIDEMPGTEPFVCPEDR